MTLNLTVLISRVNRAKYSKHNYEDHETTNESRATCTSLANLALLLSVSTFPSYPVMRQQNTKNYHRIVTIPHSTNLNPRCCGRSHFDSVMVTTTRAETFYKHARLHMQWTHLNGRRQQQQATGCNDQERLWRGER